MENDYPRLCGGTFLSLVLLALKQRTSARGHIASERDGLSNPEVLCGLIRVINPDFKKPNKDTFDTNTSNYIKCRISNGTYFPFDEPATIDSFDKRVKNDYQAALKHMSHFVNTFIEVGTAVGKDVRLVKALIELIAADESIGGEEQFYSCENGHYLTKTDLIEVKEVCLPAFLLGIWHYIILYKKDNTVGIETYNRWHKAPEERRGKWTFIGSNGASITRDIKVNFRSEPIENMASADESPTSEQPLDSRGHSLSPVTTSDSTDPKRITVNNYGTVQNQKFISIETMNGDINL